MDLGATVINLSEAACAPVGTGIDDAAVGQAIRYAFDRNVVVVAAAGNIGSQGLCSAQNEVEGSESPARRCMEFGANRSPARHGSPTMS